MKKLVSVLLVGMALLLNISVYAGDKETKKTERRSSEGAGFVNIGLGMGYYGSIPVMADFEFGIIPEITVGPTVGFGVGHGWFSIGAKGRYYFDHLINADSKFDLYGGASLNLAVVKGNDEGRYGGGVGLMPDVHIGGRYHFAKNLSGLLELSSGVSSIGVSFRI